MISSNVSSTDFKVLTSKGNKVSSKEEDSSFLNEMIESEKKMKKKTKLDGRENVGAQQAQSSLQQSRSNGAKKQENRPNSKTRSRSPQEVAKASTDKKSSSTVNPTQAKDQKEAIAANPQATTTQETNSSSVTSQQNQFPPSMSSELLTSMNSGGKGFSLEGFEQVEPQALSTSLNSELDTRQGLGQQADTALAPAALPSGTGMLDLSSQNSEDTFSGSELTADFAAVQNLGGKESTPTTQTFANVLDTKLASTETVKKENVDQMITQASTILKDGGGEMKLQLRPEGLGTVDLKVGVQNGQVSVEILAQDQNIKKMFEDSIFDIRSALETQNLKIDTFNVGVSDKFDQSLGQQASQQFAEQEFARNFMGQFREDRQALRNQGLDSMIQNASPFSSKPEGLSPATTARNPNGRLNVVA